MDYPRSKSLPWPQAATVGLRSDTFDETALREWIQQRTQVAYSLGLLDAKIAAFLASICGPTNDLQHVEFYDETKGLVSRKFVDTYAPSVGQLQWIDDLDGQFRGPGESPGNVSGKAWGSGGLIAGDLFLTAGHCFSRTPPRGHMVPRRDGKPISRRAIARLMQVNFNYQLDGTSTSNPKKERAVVSYLVDELVEISEEIDFALVRLRKGDDGKSAETHFGKLNVAAKDAKPGETLCVIQHPNGGPKQVESGRAKDITVGLITYNDIDTLGASSGSPVLSGAGEIVGVHTDGGCHQYGAGGYNWGTAIGVIRCASKRL